MLDPQRAREGNLSRRRRWPRLETGPGIVSRRDTAIVERAHLLPWPFARGMAGVLFLTGLFARVLPLVQGPGLLVRQPTEDGYLMFTVARNMALGLGMSSAAGTISTNGVQPLATLIDAGCFWLAGGDRTRGVAVVMGLSVLVAVLSFGAMYRLGEVVFATFPDGRSLAAISAALWFASPVVTPHSMNGLETGLYLLMLSITMRFFFVHGGDPDVDLTWRDTALLGALLGILFWARNDSIFLAVAVAACRLGMTVRRSTAVVARRFLELLVAGAVMGTIAAPWLVSNALRFGSIVPLSGKAESTSKLGVNLTRMPAKLAEYVTVTGAIPNALEGRWVIQLASLLLVFAAVLAVLETYRRSRRARSTARLATVCVLGLTHAALLTVFYGVFFGAGHFLSRYTSPISIPSALLTVAVIASVLGRWRWARYGCLLLLGLTAVVADVRRYRQRGDHMHFQVVEWVNTHVPPEAWAGAVQSGTLGFFHDRTINLDGKTNPAALRAKSEGRMREYVLGSKIQYLADWSAIGTWQRWLEPEFRTIVDDRAKNLAVLERVR